jgi:transcriptional regulator with XRE-family HTH domain
LIIAGFGSLWHVPQMEGSGDFDADSPAKPRRDEREARGARASRVSHEKAYMTELGHRLRRLREERGLTQQAVAQAAGIATDMVSRLENGHYSSPGLRTLLRIAEGMGISIAAMLPELPGLAHSSPDAVLKARLTALLQRVSIDDLELIVELAATVVERRRSH